LLRCARNDGGAYSSPAPLALTGAAQRAISDTTYLPRYSGVRCSFDGMSRPSLASRSSTAGVSSARETAALSRATTAGGVPLGAKIAFYV